ncbi:MAG: DUF89 family protein [Candidatus Thermoplasmatota archaeon]|nr:DUF89 family protein [Candidatus Thermoplasmatota archaeon]
MKITPICVPCLLNRIIFESKQSTEDKEVQTNVIKNACSMLGNLYDPSECSAVIATHVHKKTYDLLNNPDPYKDLKEQSNEIAASLIPIVKERISESKNSLKTAILASIIGNTLDFGIKGASKNPNELKQVFDQFFKEGFGFDDTENVFSILKDKKSILYFTDNCGEIVFDKLVIEEMKKMFPHLSISLVVKGEPVLSDATMKDAKELGFDELVDNMFTTGGFAVGVDLMKIPEELKSEMNNADLFICKGMANYESFSETNLHPIVYFLRSKCDPIASSMQVPVHANIVKLYE